MSALFIADMPMIVRRQRRRKISSLCAIMALLIHVSNVKIALGITMDVCRRNFLLKFMVFEDRIGRSRCTIDAAFPILVRSTYVRP